MATYIHKYECASGHKKKTIATVYEDRDEKAHDDHLLLGGTLTEVEPVSNLASREVLLEAVLDEVAALIDDMSTDAPGSPRHLEPGSAEWDLFKVQQLNVIVELFNKI